MSLANATLSGLAAAVSYGCVYVFAHTIRGPAAEDIGAIPWDKFLGVGSGGLAFGVAWYFLGREEKLRSAHESVLKTHLDTSARITEKFAETIKTVLHDKDLEAQRREERLVELLGGRRNHTP